MALVSVNVVRKIQQRIVVVESPFAVYCCMHVFVCVCVSLGFTRIVAELGRLLAAFGGRRTVLPH